MSTNWKGLASNVEGMDFDRDVIEAAKEGSREAFGALLQRHRARILGMALGLTGNPAEAEDLAQETFIKAFENIERFRGESQFRTWLIRILINLSASRYRQIKRIGRVITGLWKKREDEKDSEDVIERAAGSEGEQPERAAEANMAARAVDGAVQRLAEKQKVVFILRHMEGYAMQEIAGILGVSEGSVKVHLFRAIRNLREILKDWEKIA